MTLTLTATAQPTNEPPRVLLEVTEDDPLNALQAVTLYRDGVRIRFDAVVSAQTAIAYDYDAPFDVLLNYSALAEELNTEPEWTETWASLASWTGSGWSVGAGIATSTAPDATIYRSTASDITQVDVTAPSNVTLELYDIDENLVGSVKVTPDGMVTLTGAGSARSVAGSGDFTLTIAAFSMTVEGTGWDAQVAFAGSARYVLLRSPGTMTFAAKYGTAGTGAGQLAAPKGLAFNSTGDLFVVDETRKKILKFVLSGGVYVFDSEFGTAGSGSGQLSKPHGIAIDGSDNILVTDYGNNKVLKYNSAGVFQSQFGTSGTGTLNGPRDLAFDSGGNVIVTDFWNYRVVKFNSAGVYQSHFGSFGTGNGQFNGPHGIVIDTGTNDMWITDWYNNRVQKFNSAGTYQSQFGSASPTPGVGDGKFTNPHSITRDTGGSLYVTDAFGYRIQRFTSAGVFSAKVGANGSGDGNFKNPTGIEVRSSGDLYVADAGTNNRVQKFVQAAGSVDDITAVGSGLLVEASATDDTTLSPTGDQAGIWLTNAAQPELAILAEASPVSSDDPYWILPSTRESGGLSANTVALAIEGSAEVITVAVGPRRKETWTLDIACTTQSARNELLALLADSAAINLRPPATAAFLGLDGGFYAVGDVSVDRLGHPQLGPIAVVSLPLTPSKAPAYKALWQWNMRTLAQTGMSMADVNNAYPTMRDLLIGPV